MKSNEKGLSRLQIAALVGILGIALGAAGLYLLGLLGFPLLPKGSPIILVGGSLEGFMMPRYYSLSDKVVDFSLSGASITSIAEVASVRSWNVSSKSWQLSLEINKGTVTVKEENHHLKLYADGSTSIWAKGIATMHAHLTRKGYSTSDKLDKVTLTVNGTPETICEKAPCTLVLSY